MVRLEPMSEGELAELRRQTVADFIAGKCAAGYLDAAGARALAEQTFDGLLPDGLATAGQQLLAVLDAETGDRVGLLWFGLTDRGAGPLAYIFGGLIREPYRRRGYARAALQALERAAAAAGARQLALQLFGGNAAARALFEQAGYRVSDVMLAKSL
jgi:GNAT superfamily N-acetyltransferase